MLRSIVEYYAQHESYKCGYCRRPDTNFSHGMWAHTITVGDYQDLIDRGWRRSGKYCYKPTMDVTCCPMYTIRCRAEEFKASKSQKKVLKRFNKYLLGDSVSQTEVQRKMSTCSSGSEVLYEGFEEGGEQFVESTKEHHDINIDDMNTSIEIKDTEPLDERPADLTSTRMEQTSENGSITTEDHVTHTREGNKDVGADPNRAPCKKAKQLRKERKFEKLKGRGIDAFKLDCNIKNKEKQLEEFINELPNELKQKLQIRLVRTNPPSPEWLATAKEAHEVYVKYQTTIHGDKLEKCTEPKFSDFLVQSPLLEEYKDNGPPCGYGSFHQQYWLDGRIIAVGVIDILPKCVSSVYFYYDPQYMNLTLGSYGALREIEFTRQLNSQCPDLKYYYMGYYIHTCRKMRYKGNYFPSDLLCPETYKWFPLRDCIPKLDATAYSRLDPDIDSVDENIPKESDMNYIPVWLKGTVMPYKMYKRKFTSKKHDQTEVMEYARLVGVKSAKSLLLVR